MFGDIIKSIKADAEVSISIEGGKASIRAIGTSWSININEAVDEYPKLPKLEVSEFVLVNRGDFLTKIGKVLVAVSRDIKRPEMQLVRIMDNSIIATDGAQCQEESFPFDDSLVLSLSVLEQLVFLLKRVEVDTFMIGQTNEQIVVRVNSDEFVGAKAIAKFPNVDMLKERVTGNNILVSGTKEILLGAIKRVRILANQETNAISLSISKGRGVFRCEDKFGNFAEEVVDIFYDGEDRVVNANANFLYNLIETNSDPTVNLYLGTDEGSRRSYILLKEEGHIGILSQVIM